MNRRNFMLAALLAAVTAGCATEPDRAALPAAAAAATTTMTTPVAAKPAAEGMDQITVSQHHSHRPVSLSFAHKAEVETFVKAAAAAAKIQGVLDVVANDYDLTFYKDGKAVKRYLLWLKAAGKQSMIMDAEHTETGYILDKESMEAIKGYLSPLLQQDQLMTAEQAAAAVLRDHPDFPGPGETKSIATMTGGPAPGTKVTGRLSTTVEPWAGKGEYRVTLRKDWDMTFSGKKLSGHWTYKVTADAVQLIESEDNTDLVNQVK
jgi:hypothetical protein